MQRPPRPFINDPFGTSALEQAPLTPISIQVTVPRTVVALSPPVDLWERIRRGYAMPDLENSLVHDREQWYAAKPDYIFRMTERSKKYLFHIVEELELRNMPTELALLPFIESAFNPQAVSSAKAAGMWQFMPATGKYFELKQNAFRDDRHEKHRGGPRGLQLQTATDRKSPLLSVGNHTARYRPHAGGQAG
jgi:membrane-bound lytic murein transglycosylase D